MNRQELIVRASFGEFWAQPTTNGYYAVPGGKMMTEVEMLLSGWKVRRPEKNESRPALWGINGIHEPT